MSGVKIYLLGADLAARGLLGKVDCDLNVVDLKGFILLTEQHETHMKWA